MLITLDPGICATWCKPSAHQTPRLHWSPNGTVCAATPQQPLMNGPEEHVKEIKISTRTQNAPDPNLIMLNGTFLKKCCWHEGVWTMFGRVAGAREFLHQYQEPEFTIWRLYCSHAQCHHFICRLISYTELHHSIHVYNWALHHLSKSSWITLLCNNNDNNKCSNCKTYWLSQFTFWHCKTSVKSGASGYI